VPAPARRVSAELRDTAAQNSKYSYYGNLLVAYNADHTGEYQAAPAAQHLTPESRTLDSTVRHALWFCDSSVCASWVLLLSHSRPVHSL